MTYNITPRPYRPENNRAGNVQKKSGHPTQPGNRSTAPKTTQRSKKQQAIIYQFVRTVKRVKWKRIAVLSLSVLGAYHLITSACDAIFSKDETPTAKITEITRATDLSDLSIIIEPLEPAHKYIFRDGEGTPVDMQTMTNAWAAEAGYVKRYELTDAERWEVASVVTAEAGGEPYAGMMAVAQCILQACEDDGIRPDEAVIAYKYTANRPEPSAEALKAVQAVFDFGQVVTTEPIKYYYAPAIVYSEWHESQDYVITINNHRFYTEKETEQ